MVNVGNASFYTQLRPFSIGVSLSSHAQTSFRHCVPVISHYSLPSSCLRLLRRTGRECYKEGGIEIRGPWSEGREGEEGGGEISKNKEKHYFLT